MIYLRGLTAVHRVITWLRDVQNTHAELFLWDVPPGAEQVLAGVGFGAEQARASFGALRSNVVAAALDLHRMGTYDEFYAEVLNRFRASNINPDQPHLNLPSDPHTEPPVPWL